MKPFLYQRLIRSLLLEVASGLFPERTPFLSFRQIGAGWNVSRDTIEVTLDFLVEQEILESRNRSKFKLRPGAVQRARLMLGDCEGPAPLRFSMIARGLRMPRSISIIRPPGMK